MENGVGETPMDISSLIELLWRIRQGLTFRTRITTVFIKILNGLTS